MKNAKKLLSLLLCFVLLSAIAVPICSAYSPSDDMPYSETSFYVMLKEEYYDKASEVIASIDCEYVTDVLNLSNPDDYDGPYSVMLGILLSDEEGFELAQNYFRKQDYFSELYYEPLMGPSTRGDVDNDGKITANDARLVLRAAVNLEKVVKYYADIDVDGRITASDARIVLRKSVGLDG